MQTSDALALLDTVVKSLIKTDGWPSLMWICQSDYFHSHTSLIASNNKYSFLFDLPVHDSSWLTMQRVNLLEKTLLLEKTEGRRRRGWQMTRCLNGITNSVDMSLSKLQEMVKDREAWDLQSWGHRKLDTTEQLNNNKLLKWQGNFTSGLNNLKSVTHFIFPVFFLPPSL